MTPISQNASTQADEKQVGSVQVEQINLATPLPNAFKVDGGLILSTEGLKDSSGVQTAEDGRVS